SQAQEQSETARHRLDRAKDLHRIAEERLKSANAVAAKADELARQCSSAATLEAVQHARQVGDAVASQVREVARDIQPTAEKISGGERAAGADLREGQQKLDAAMGQLEREMAALAASHGHPDEDTQNLIESAAGDVEAAAGQVESAAGDVEAAVGQMEAVV